jgi:hypothetical protein
MVEGWHGDTYLVLFEGSEVSSASLRYRVTSTLPGYEVVGLSGWDDLIVRNSAGSTFTIPVLPLDPQYLSPFQTPVSSVSLKVDDRYTGKVKWYIKPVVFGGDPAVGENLTWVDHDQHGKLAVWWNNLYRDLQPKRDA